MTCLARLYRWISTAAILREQIEALHGRVRVLETELECAKRINNRMAEELFESREMLLEHSYGCVPARGDLT